MPSIPRRPRSTLLSIFALWAIFYASFTLFTPPLLDDADSVHAEVAREMLLRHDYVTLYANGIRYLEKAPLLYWSMALSFKLFGVSPAAARIPLALTILALALVTEAFARRAFRTSRAGLYAALIILSSPGIFLYTRLTLPDAMVCLWLTLALYAFYLTEQFPPTEVVILSAAKNPRILPEAPQTSRLNLRLLCHVFAATCALNVLTKGLIGIVFPTAIVLIYLLFTRGLHGAIARIRQLHPLSSLLVFVAIAAPWHILIALANPTRGHPGNLTLSHGHFAVPLPTDGNVHGWLWFYFVNEQLLRYLNLRVPRDYDTVPLYLFWGLCFIWLMPFSAFALKVASQNFGSILDTWRRRSSFPVKFLPRLLFNDKNLLLLQIWAGFVLAFFLLSTRQEYYVLPAIPAAAIAIAGWLAPESRWVSSSRLPQVRKRRAAIAHSLYVLLAIGVIFAIFTAYVLVHTRTPAPSSDLAELLQQNPADYALSMGHFLDLNARALALFRVPLVLATLSLLFGPLTALLLRKGKGSLGAKPHYANFALAAGAFTFLLAAHLALQTFAPVLSSQQLATAIAPQLHADDLIVIHQEYEFASTLGFYLRRNDLHILEGRSSNLWYGSFFPDAPAIFETPATLAQKWPNPQRIWVWQDLANQPSPLPPLPGPIYVIAKSGGKEIVSNQPNHR